MGLTLYASIAILTILCVLSSKVRYYVKFTYFTTSALISATVFIPLMLRRPGDYRNANLPARSLKFLSKILNLKFELRGQENIINDSGCVVLINHQSAIDLLVLAEIWPVMERCAVIAKRSLFYLWPFGLATWLWGTVFIDRAKTDQAKKTLYETGKAINDKQAKLCMFPEGTRHGGECLLEFKKGAFHVAVGLQCPIQPVVVSRYYFLNAEKCVFNPGKAVIEILPPISTVGLSKDEMHQLISKTYTIMNERYINLTKEVMEECKKND